MRNHGTLSQGKLTMFSPSFDFNGDHHLQDEHIVLDKMGHQQLIPKSNEERVQLGHGHREQKAFSPQTSIQSDFF